MFAYAPLGASGACAKAGAATAARADVADMSRILLDKGVTLNFRMLLYT
jgi:hypothetical protein